MVEHYTVMAINLNSGVYTAVVKVDNSSVNSSVTILKTTNGSDVSKVINTATPYYATFRDTAGKYLPNGSEVMFNINGVLYHRQVNGSEGIARLNLNFKTG